MVKTVEKEELEEMKILFPGKSKGFVYLTAVIMLAGISFVMIGINSLVSAKYRLVIKQSELFYKSIEENNALIMEEK